MQQRLLHHWDQLLAEVGDDGLALGGVHRLEQVRQVGDVLALLGNAAEQAELAAVELCHHGVALLRGGHVVQVGHDVAAVGVAQQLSKVALEELDQGCRKEGGSREMGVRYLAVGRASDWYEACEQSCGRV